MHLVQRLPNVFERDPNLSLLNVLRYKRQTAYVHMKKVMVVWMVFGSK